MTHRSAEGRSVLHRDHAVDDDDEALDDEDMSADTDRRHAHRVNTRMHTLDGVSH